MIKNSGVFSQTLILISVFSIVLMNERIGAVMGTPTESFWVSPPIKGSYLRINPTGELVVCGGNINAQALPNLTVRTPEGRLTDHWINTVEKYYSYPDWRGDTSKDPQNHYPEWIVYSKVFSADKAIINLNRIDREYSQTATIFTDGFNTKADWYFFSETKFPNINKEFKDKIIFERRVGTSYSIILQDLYQDYRMTPPVINNVYRPTEDPATHWIIQPVVLLTDARSPAWSPDGKKIAYAKGSPLNIYISDFDPYFDNGPRNSIGRIVPNTEVQVTVTEPGRHCFDPVFSPCGTKIAFAKETGVINEWEVWVIYLDQIPGKGTRVARVTSAVTGAKELKRAPSGWLTRSKLFIHGKDRGAAGVMEYIPYVVDLNITFPAVIFVSPAPGEVNVPLNSNITVIFNKRMRPDSVNENTFIVKDDLGNTVSGRIDKTENPKFVFIPDYPFIDGRKYTVRIVSTFGVVEDVPSGADSINGDYVWEFTAGRDLTPPKIKSVSPLPHTVAVVDESISVTFNEFINPNTIDARNFIVKDFWGRSVNGRIITVNNPTIIFEPLDCLIDETTYTVRIVATVEDISGNKFDGNGNGVYEGSPIDDYLFIFYTDPRPVVVKMDPSENALNVSFTATIKVVFSEIINPLSINSESFKVIDTKTGKSIAGIFDYSENPTIYFSPLSPFTPDTTYTVVISTLIFDLQGNRLAKMKKWEFRTRDTIPPTLVFQLPKGIPVDITSKIGVKFSEPIDISTLNIDSFFVQKGLTKLDGSISYDPKTMTAFFIPATALEYETTYVVVVTTAIKDMAGNNLSTQYTHEFITIKYVPQSPSFSIGPNLINPFKGEKAIIKYGLPKPAHVVIGVYSVSGELIKMIVDEYKVAGEYTTEWTGRNMADGIVTSGIYILNIHTDYFVENRKMVIKDW